MRSFVAIDFETADSGYDSACALGLIRVDEGKIVHRESALIRPPRSRFEFTHIHGIHWHDVEKEPPFAEIWKRFAPWLKNASFVAAHNASFDRQVLSTCCEAANITLPSIEFLCTVGLARRVWKIFPTKLPNVCSYLNIPLRHHDPLSDAEACAQIVIAAQMKSASL